MSLLLGFIDNSSLDFTIKHLIITKKIIRQSVASRCRVLTTSWTIYLKYIFSRPFALISNWLNISHINFRHCICLPMVWQEKRDFIQMKVFVWDIHFSEIHYRHLDSTVFITIGLKYVNADWSYSRLLQSGNYFTAHITNIANMYIALTRWRHQMETFSALMALCAGNSPVTGEFPAHSPVTRSFDVFFDLRPNKRLSIIIVRLVIWGAIVPIMTSQ